MGIFKTTFPQNFVSILFQPHFISRLLLASQNFIILLFDNYASYVLIQDINKNIKQLRAKGTHPRNCLFRIQLFFHLISHFPKTLFLEIKFTFVLIFMWGTQQPLYQKSQVKTEGTFLPSQESMFFFLGITCNVAYQVPCLSTSPQAHLLMDQHAFPKLSKQLQNPTLSPGANPASSCGAFQKLWSVDQVSPDKSAVLLGVLEPWL